MTRRPLIRMLVLTLSWHVSTLVMAASGPPSSTLRIDNAPGQFDYLVEPAGDDSGEKPGHVQVFAKGQSEPFQTLELAYLEPLLNGEPSRPFDGKGAIIVEDFNFDGHPDLAVRSGNLSMYQGESYAIFLYSEAQQRFVPNQALTAVVENSIGMFQVDTKKHRLYADARSGIHQSIRTEYEMVGDTPQERVVEIDEVIDDANPDVLMRTVQHMQNGKWVTVSEKKVRRSP